MADEKWVDVELYVMVDENGDYVVAKEGGHLAEAYDDDVGCDSQTARRILTLKLRVEKPRTVELMADVPLQADGAELVELK